jgi:uncharacterized protein with HEPN domain
VSRDERDRLSDVKEAIAAIRAHLEAAGGHSNDLLLHDALLFQFVVIDEAASTSLRDAQRRARDHLGGRSRPARPHRPRGPRIDIERVLAIVDHDLPALEWAIDRLLGA